MIVFDFYMIFIVLIRFYMVFILLLYGFHMIWIITSITILVIVIIMILEAGPHFSILPFFFDYQRLVGLLTLGSQELSNRTYWLQDPFRKCIQNTCQ